MRFTSMDNPLCQNKSIYKQLRQVLSLQALTSRVLAEKNLIISEAVMVLK